MLRPKLFSNAINTVNLLLKGVNNISHTKEYQRYVKSEKQRLLSLERQRRYGNQNIPIFSWIWRHALMIEDWICLALLGIIMALLSVGVDKGIELCLDARSWFYHDLTSSPILSYICWITIPTILVLFAVIFVKMLAPQSVGSGIPEVKTILRGFPIENHLTFKTLIAKVIGLTATLGSGLPLGKEAPFVHISCIVARLLNKMILKVKGVNKDDTHKTEMLVAGCAAGIAACFASPIGGVLYSIEATSTYFAVRNYWRGFFAAVCSAVVFRLHAVWMEQIDTITALFATNFPLEFTFDPQELFIFALIGVICGFLGSFWVWLFRQYSIFIKSNEFVSKIIQINFLLYPTIMIVIISSITCPNSYYNIAGHLSTHDQMTQLFSNFTWSQQNLTQREASIVSNWQTQFHASDDTNVIQNLIIYLIYSFLFSIIASTIAVPSGTFIPVIKIGACLGRLIGESIHVWFPFGVYFSERLSPILPGGYAVVGAVAFAGATTHTVSVAVMALEMTGQISLIAPIMITVLISNAIAVHLSPSIYDTIISLKKLPYVPELLQSSGDMNNIIVKSFMVKDVIYIWQGMDYITLQMILMENVGLHHLPLVESRDGMILLGSVQRNELIKIIATQINRDKLLYLSGNYQQESQAIPYKEKDELYEQCIHRRPSRQDVAANDVTKVSEAENNEILPLPPQARRSKDISQAPNGFTTELSKIIANRVATTRSRFRSAFNSTFQNESTTLLDQSDAISIIPSAVRRLTLENEMKYTRMISTDHATASPEDHQPWEFPQINEVIDFDQADIDPAPFQLVEKTSISMVHTLFTKLGLRRAYVTQLGRLVGVVGLKELRTSIENVNNGKMMIDSTDFGLISEAPLQILRYTDLDSNSTSEVIPQNNSLLNISTFKIDDMNDDIEKSIGQSEK